MNDLKKSCGNCKYFEKHYVWADGHFYATCFGHCNACRRAKQKLESHICDKWEQTVDKIKTRKNNIKEELLRMAMRVKDIVSFLEIEQNIDK